MAPRFKAQIKHEKVNDFIENFNVFNFFFLFFLFLKFCNFFFLTDVSNYCEERKIKLLINVYIKISRNLGGIPVNKFQAFYEHSWERPNPEGILPIMAYTGGSKRGTFFRH